jgi:hypothetical protein
MAHEPRSSVIAASDLAMDLKGANPLFALRHQVGNLKPRAERVLSILENCPADHAESIALRRAFVTLPLKRLLENVDFLVSTPSAADAVGPARIA